MKLILTRLWEVLRSHWKVLLVVVAAMIVAWQIRSFFAKRENDLLAQMEDLNKIHEEQLDKIKKAHDEERIRTEKNIKKLEEDLRISQQQYESALQELDNKKKINIAKTVTKYNDDPVGLAKKVQSITGFELVLQEGQK